MSGGWPAPASEKGDGIATVDDKAFWTEIVRGAGIILKAIAARYTGKSLKITSSD